MSDFKQVNEDAFTLNGYSKHVSFMANKVYDINGILTTRMILDQDSVSGDGKWKMTTVEVKRLSKVWWDDKVFYDEARKQRNSRPCRV
jgi:hypothetical protein